MLRFQNSTIEKVSIINASNTHKHTHNNTLAIPTYLVSTNVNVNE